MSAFDASQPVAPRGPSARQLAVALGYRPGNDRAPRVVARGWDRAARRIVDLAREHDVPVREDRDLAGVLAQLDLEQEIPEELYKAVAEVLAFIYRINTERGSNG